MNIFGNKVLGLLNSGANQVFVNERFCLILKNLGIFLVEDILISCRGYISLPINLHNKIHLFNCYVVPELRHNPVLGTVFWIEMGIIPDLKNSCWHSAEDTDYTNTNELSFSQSANNLN